LNAHADARDAVLNALSQNAGAPGLFPVMRTATEPTIRSQATRLLRELQDPGAGDAFMAVLAQVPATATDEVQRNIRKHAIFGLAEIGDARAADGLMELVQRPLQPGVAHDPNADMDARLALDALRKIPNACVAAKNTLLELLPRGDFMRTQLLLALGETGDASIAPRIMSYLTDENAQEGAAVAIARLNYAPGIARIRADMIRPRNLNMSQETVQDEPVFIKRRNAIRAIAWTHSPTYAADLERIIEDPQDRNALREEAGHALASIADDHTIDDVATRALDTTKPENTRQFYLYALRGRSNPATSNRLVEAYLRPGTPAGLMRTAAIAAGFGGDDTTAAALRPLLASTDSNVQLNASIAAILCGDEATAQALLEQLTAHRDLADLLSNTFVTRSATGNNTGMQLEPMELMPITRSMFEDGRIYRRVNMANLLERGRAGQHFDFASVWLKLRIKNGWESPIGIGPFEIRAALREAARGGDRFRSDMSFKMFRALNDRGSLLWLRRQTGDAAERARRELVDMNAGGT
jgi:HEAT repeat protein